MLSTRLESCTAALLGHECPLQFGLVTYHCLLMVVFGRCTGLQKAGKVYM